MRSSFQKRLRRPTLLEWFFILSVVFHAALLWRGTREYEPYHFDERPPIEITQAPAEKISRKAQAQAKPKPQKRPEIAETEEAPNKKLDPNATVLSERNQTADQEMKASQTDDFRKKTGTGLKNSLSRNNVPPPTGDPEAKSKDDGMGTKPEPSSKNAAGVKRNWKSLSLKDLGLGGDGGMIAATDDRLQDVARGDRTVLSTREFKFYSYYHRIKETLRQFWKPNVERKLAVLWSRGAKMKDGEIVTQLVVMIDEKGTVTRVTRMTSSGFESLDDAATEAFQQASPFPNPPAGMRDPDGLVRIRWDFILKTEASPQISFRGRGAP